jgi:protein-S-isoprenylcysteine O-methyltransferase Ste14
MSERLAALLKSIVFATLFVWLWTVGFPRWLALPGSSTPIRTQPLRLLGLVPLIAGALICLACIWNFIFIGRGTPAPFDAPKKLVVVGPYRYVRNPMYLGFALVLLGEAIMLAVFSWRLVEYGLAMVVAVNLLVIFYEEPTLTKRFGESYDTYRANVRRWIPRLRPWTESN